MFGARDTDRADLWAKAAQLASDFLICEKWVWGRRHALSRQMGTTGALPRNAERAPRITRVFKPRPSTVFNEWIIHVITFLVEGKPSTMDSPPTPVFFDLNALSSSPSSFPEESRGKTTWHTLFSSPLTPTTCMSGGVATCPPNGTLALHRHKQAEIYFIISGSGEVEIDGKRTRVSKDTAIWIPGDAEHGVFCGDGEELKWFYVFPEGSFESVVYRFSHEAEDKKVMAKL